MFGNFPSLQSVLASARTAHHYTIDISPGGVKMSALDADDHRNAMEAMPHLMRAAASMAPQRPLSSPPVQPLPVQAPLAEAQVSAVAHPAVPAQPAPALQTIKVVPVLAPVQSNALQIVRAPKRSVIEAFSIPKPVPVPRATLAPPGVLSPSPDLPAVEEVSGARPRPAPRATYRARISETEVSFLAHLKQANLSEGMQDQSRCSIRIFKDIVGDKFVDEVDARDVDKFMMALSVFPKHANHSRKYRGLTARSIVERAKDIPSGRISKTTQDKHSDRMRYFFKWCVEREEIYRSPFQGRPRLSKKALGVNKARTYFDKDDLNNIFLPEHTATWDTPHKFWVPLLAYFQGMRINEICQLYVDDIITEQGVRGIDVSPDRHGQRLKNDHSRRFLPIHKELIRLGFMKYLKDAKAAGATHLFPGLKWGKNGPGDSVGDWFNRTYLRNLCGIHEKKKTFHSFRHNFVSFGIWSRVPDAELSELIGHSAARSCLREHYSHPAGAPLCAKQLAQIEFPELELPVYKKGQFNTYLTGAIAKTKREERNTA